MEANKSITVNGCSVCAAGEENHTTFNPVHRPYSVYYQYDYRHITHCFRALTPHWNAVVPVGTNG